MTDSSKADSKASADKTAGKETSADATALTDEQVEAATGGGEIIISKTTDKASLPP